MKSIIPKEINKARLIKAILLILSVMIFVADVGEVHLSPVKNKVECNNVAYLAEDEISGALVEEKFQTLYFYNARHQIVAVTNMKAEGQDVSWITGLAIKDGDILVKECKLDEGSTYIENESIQAYKRSGKLIREVLSVDYDEDDNITVPQIDGNSEEEVGAVTMTLTYSGWFFIKNLLYWLSILVIAIFILALIRDFFRHKVYGRYKNKLLLCFAVLLTVGFYSFHTYKIIYDFYKAMVSTAADQIGAFFENVYLNDIDTIIDSGDIYGSIDEEVKSQDIIEKQQIFKDYFNANDSDYNYYATIYILDPDNDQNSPFADGNVMYSYLDSRGVFKSGQKIVLNSGMISSFVKDDDNEIYFFNSGVDSSMFAYSIIKNAEGKSVALVRVDSLISNIMYNETEVIGNTLFDVSAILILIYVLYILFGRYSEDIRRLIKRDRSDRTGRILDMSGIYVFFYIIAGSIDSAIVVYVAKSLCEGLTSSQIAAMAAVPIAAKNTGMLIAFFISGPLLKKLGERKMGIIGSILGFAGMLLMALAIKVNNIYLLDAGKLIQGIFGSGLLYVIADTMPLNAENDEQKKKAINYSQMSIVGAGILAALIGGYISEYAGYEFLYIAGSFAYVILLFLTVFTFGRKSFSTDVRVRKTANNGMLENWTVFLKKPLLTMMIFYLLPYILLYGYTGYIFPLYTAEAGISVLLISNISVYGKLFTFIHDEVIEKYTRKMDVLSVMLIPTALFSAGLMYFMVTSSVLWAIILYFAISLVVRMEGVGIKLFVTGMAERYNCDVKSVLFNGYTIESVIFIIQSPILSAFMAIGTNAGTALTGLVCFVMIIISGLFQKKK